jgi:hypothetical protein
MLGNGEDDFSEVHRKMSFLEGAECCECFPQAFYLHW